MAVVQTMFRLCRIQGWPEIGRFLARLANGVCAGADIKSAAMQPFGLRPPGAVLDFRWLDAYASASPQHDGC